jgi:hypothetical protein
VPGPGQYDDGTGIQVGLAGGGQTEKRVKGTYMTEVGREEKEKKS